MRPVTSLLGLLLLAAPALADDALSPGTGTIRGRLYSPYAPRYVVEQPVTLRFATAGGIDLGVTSTDDEGQFVLENVPVGFHRLVAWRRSEGSRPLPEIAVRPGETVEEVAVVVEPQAVIRVRVETPSGRPARVERVVAENPPHAVGAREDRRDTRELRLTPGTWRLVVHATGFRTYEEEITIESFERVYRTVALKSGHSLVGTVVDETTGKPIAGAEVERLARLRPLADGARWTTGPNGRFDLPGGAPGASWFRVTAPGCEAALEEIDLEDRFITRHVFRLKRLAPTGAVAGRVVDDRGRGRAGLSVVALPAVRRHPPRRATTGDDGAFRIEALEAGTVTVTVEDPNDELDTDFVTARPGEDALRLTVRRRPVLLVTAADETGARPALWRVRWRVARAVDDVEEGVVDVTDGGGARLVLPRAGAATLEADVPGRNAPPSLEVEAGWDEERPVGFEVTGPPADARVLGWVMRRDATPLDDVPFTLWLRHLDGRLERLETNALGGYRRRDLPPGRYEVIATRGRRLPDEGSPRVAGDLVSGQARKLDLPLDAALVVTRLAGRDDEALREGDAILRVAGDRMTQREKIDEIVAYFGDRRVRVELVRNGEPTEVWVEPASSLAEHTYDERVR